MSDAKLRRLRPADISPRRGGGVDDVTLNEAARIVREVRDHGETAVRRHAARLGDLSADKPLVYDRSSLATALDSLAPDDRDLLYRTALRIRTFAEAQRQSLADLTIHLPGGRAGHEVTAVERAGCYAPGGRFPLPSSVLMTAVTARVAGVADVIVASPRPETITLAAAAVADADCVLGVGGAQAVAAMAYGAGSVPPCDIIVGPGNRWVTAAKQCVAGTVGIDMLAGPSELVVLADESADAAIVAADLLAQAEHDPDALLVLISTHEPLISAVELELNVQLSSLPTADTAREALRNGYAVIAADSAEAAGACDRIAPEHLAIHVAEPETWSSRLKHYGALFIGQRSAEVFGDYGVGPNHVLPTGGAARTVGGLSVLSFLRVRTWMQLDNVTNDVADDVARFARLERLEAHARSAEKRV